MSINCLMKNNWVKAKLIFYKYFIGAQNKILSQVSAELKMIYKFLFFFIGYEQLSTNSIFLIPSKLICVPNFGSVGWFSFSAVDSFWQLMTAVTQKNYWNFHVDTKVDMFAKVQLSRVIFVFTSCYQLLTSDDSW